MNRLLWVLQIVFGLYFIATGIAHFVVPEGLPDFVSWMYDLTQTQHTVAGVAEIAGGLGLILPGLTGIRPQLAVWAALGLMLVMVLAAVWHVGRDELVNMANNVFIFVVLGFIAYGRWRVEPMRSR